MVNKVKIWHRQENIRLVAQVQVGAYGKSQRATRFVDLAEAELQPLSIGTSWRVGRSPLSGIRIIND
jgi:hypothetical protein